MHYLVPSFVSSGVISKVMEDPGVTDRILGKQWTYAMNLVIGVRRNVMNMVVSVWKAINFLHNLLLKTLLSHGSDHL